MVNKYNKIVKKMIKLKITEKEKSKSVNYFLKRQLMK